MFEKGQVEFDMLCTDVTVHRTLYFAASRTTTTTIYKLQQQFAIV